MSEVIRAFGIETTSTLTGLSTQVLANWDRSGFFTPALAYENRKVRQSRIYSYQDILALKVLSDLQGRFNVSTQHLKKAKQWLGILNDADWADAKLYVDIVKRRVATPDDVGHIRDAEDGQRIFEFAIGPVRDKIAREVDRFQERSEAEVGETSRKRGVVGNAEVVEGTRIPVSAIQSFVANGFSDEEIITNYPSLTKADVQAVRKRASTAA
ncbi:MAG: DUF433 domain-containing protein [Pseudomonadota bacterium]